ncbi:MAG: hypothetical protein AAF735_05795 [Myxococcota bacterium]
MTKPKKQSVPFRRRTILAILCAPLSVVSCGEELDIRSGTDAVEAPGANRQAVQTTVSLNRQRGASMKSGAGTTNYWEQDTPFPLYFSSSSGIAVQSRRLPYFDNNGPASDLNTGGDRDISAVDGWVSIYRDFGEPDSASPIPVFILYNKFRGVLRFFFYNTTIGETFSHGIVTLSQPFAGKRGALFNFGEENYFLDTYNSEIKLTSLTKIAPFQWSYVDYTVTGYTPTLPTDATLSFTIQGATESQIQLDGSLTLEQVLSDANVSGKLDLGGGLSGGYKAFKGANKAVDEIEGLTKKEPDAWWSKLVKPLLGGSFSSIVSGVAGAAGFFKSFLMVGKSNATQPLNFKGEIELTGTITTVTDIFEFKMRTPGAPLSDPNDFLRPDYDKPLGIYNLPRPTFDVVTEEDCWYNSHWDEWECSESFEFGVENDDLEVAINPHIGASVSASIGFVEVREEMTYESVESFQTRDFAGYIGPSWATYNEDDVVLQVVVSPPSGSSYTSPVTIVNTYDPRYVYSY